MHQFHAHHLLKRMIWFLCTALSVYSAQAQITITSSDIQSVYTIGNSLKSLLALGPLTITVGDPSSSPQIWDFRDIAFADAGVIDPVAPSEAPAIPDFSSANCVLRETLDDSTGIPLVVYTYHSLTSTEYSMLGMCGDSGKYVIRYRPPVSQMKFPFHMGLSWTQQSPPETTEVIPGYSIITTTSHNHSVDAFGTLRLPDGDYEVLRDKVVTVAETETQMGKSRSKGITYNFVTIEMGGATVSLDSTQDGLSTVTAKGGIGAVVPGTGTVSVAERNLAPEGFWLSQNYPNPFNPSTNITFSLQEAGTARLIVFDALGRQVQLLLDSRLGKGVHSAVWTPGSISTGPYFYRLEVNGRCLTRRLLFLK